MKALVIGGTSFIGKRLCERLWEKNWQVTGTTRKTCDLLNLPDKLPYADAVWICAAMTRFIDCESDKLAHRVNVDAPPAIVKLLRKAWQEALKDASFPHFSRIIFLSSEAVYRAPRTLYGEYKWRAETGLRHECDPIIVRLCKVDAATVDDCCDYLIEAAGFPPGIYDWPQ